MFGILKFIIALYKAYVDLLNPNRNILQYTPPQFKYIISILIASLWAIAFSLYFGELYTLGYNVIGHVAIVSMAFLTWYVLRKNNYTKLRDEYDLLRDPNRLPKCYALTDEERLNAARKQQ